MPGKKKTNKYDAPFYKIFPTALFGLAGLFYLVAPYDMISSLGLDFKEKQTGHIVFGLVFIVFAVAFWLISHKKVK